MALKTRPFDPAAYLESDQARFAYLADAVRSGDVSEIADALGVVARAAGMSAIAKATGLKRPALYKSLSREGNPELATVLLVMKHLDLQLSVSPVGGRPAGKAKASKAGKAGGKGKGAAGKTIGKPGAKAVNAVGKGGKKAGTGKRSSIAA